MIENLLAATGKWAAGEAASNLYNIFLNSSFKSFLKRKEEQELKEILEEYNHRFKEQLEMASQDEELVIDGLIEYTEKRLLSDFLNSLLLTENIYRKEARRRILEGAYRAANATKKGQKENVKRYIDTVFIFLEEFALQKLTLEQIIKMNILEDSLVDQMEQMNRNLHNELLLLSNSLIDKDSFANMIDQIEPKESNKNTFHYLNDSIGFWGREEEMQVLKDFLEDDRPVLYTAIIAPGGCGKSKLVYEFVKANRYNTEWEMQYLEGSHIHRLMEFRDYCYPRNLVLIVDYAGIYVDKLGEWLNHLLRLKQYARPAKVRLILLERETEVKLGNIVFEPTWKKNLESLGERKSRIKDIMYVKKPFHGLGELQALSDMAIKEMMRQRGINQGYTLEDKILERLLVGLRRFDKNGISNARPLIALMMTQSYIDGKDIFNWEPQDMVEYFLERYDKQCEYLCQGNSAVVDSIKNLVFYSTVVGTINLDDQYSEYLQKDVDVLAGVSDDSYVAILSGINQSKIFRNVIIPMEPDVLGEYFVLQRLLKMMARKDKFRHVMGEFWKYPEKCFAFLSRCIFDYGTRNEFKDFFGEQIDILLPEANSKEKIEMRSDLLHILRIVIRGKKYEAAFGERMKELYEANPKYVKVAENYAAFLMLEVNNHFLEWEIQDDNVELINKLRKKFPASSYLDTIYGKSLFNQVTSYLNARKFPKQPGKASEYKAKAIENMRKLENLLKEHPENGQVKRSYEMASMHMSFSAVYEKDLMGL